MRTAAQRIAKYNARMVSSQLDPVRAALASQQQANYLGYAQEFVPKQEDLRQMLNAMSIDPAQFVFYEAFNGEMYHLWKTAAGPAAVAGAVAIIGRWAHTSRLGVGAATSLWSIATGIYNIVKPTP